MTDQEMDLGIDLEMSDLSPDADAGELSSLTMDAKLSGENVEALISDILALRYKNLQIDASAIEQADTPCVEALIAAAKQWALDGFSLTFSSVSENFAAILSTLGLDQSDLEAGELQ
jgi:chemotaxis protein CheX